MPGDGKAVVRTVGVLLLTLAAIVALRGVLPGAQPPSPEPEADGPGSMAAVVIMLVVSVTAIAVSVAARARPPRPRQSEWEPPRRDDATGGAFPWRLLAIAAAALLAWLLIVLLLMRWASTIDPSDPGAAAPPATDALEAPPEDGDARPDDGAGGSAFDLLLGTAVALLLLSVIASLTARRRTPAAPAGTDRPEPSVPRAPAPDLARAAELGLAEVGDRSRDPREAIIACYVAMEQELEKSPGTVPQASDTPAEVLARAVARRAVHAGSAAQLVDLFEEARFSPHVMNEGHRDDAVRALQVVQRELQGAT